MPTFREKIEIEHVIVAAIEKHARGDVERLARGDRRGTAPVGLRDPAANHSLMMGGAPRSHAARGSRRSGYQADRGPTAGAPVAIISPGSRGRHEKAPPVSRRGLPGIQPIRRLMYQQERLYRVSRSGAWAGPEHQALIRLMGGLADAPSGD